MTFEQIALDSYNPAYNICKIAKSMRGYKHTEEAKNKIGMAHRGSKNNTAKLTDDKVSKIRVMLAEGRPQRAIARTFGVSQGTVSQINTGITWSEK